MKPYAAMQPLFKHIPEANKEVFIGSCFRLWADNHFITAAHCIEDTLQENIGIFDILQRRFFPCINIIPHPTADLAVLEIKGQINPMFQKFTLAKCACTFGENVHCFGALTDWRDWRIWVDESPEVPARVVGGLIQRFFIHKDSRYVTPALELSMPIPQGMSGGPAFNARLSHIAVGVAIGTIKSSTVVSEIVEYEDSDVKEREKITEIIRYGVLLKLFDFTDWLKEVLPR